MEDRCFELIVAEERKLEYREAAVTDEGNQSFALRQVPGPRLVEPLADDHEALGNLGANGRRTKVKGAARLRPSQTAFPQVDESDDRGVIGAGGAIPECGFDFFHPARDRSTLDDEFAEFHPKAFQARRRSLPILQASLAVALGGAGILGRRCDWHVLIGNFESTRVGQPSRLAAVKRGAYDPTVQ
jgi:hypothetical protein